MVFFFSHILSALVVTFVCWYYARRKFPPGPRPVPILGNFHQLSTKISPLTQLQQLHKAYGPVVSLQIGQRILIVIGSHKVAKDLLTSRGATYNSRPRMVIAADYITKKLGATITPSGPSWQRAKKLQLSLLHPSKCHLYRPVQDLESRHLLFSLLSTDDFSNELHRYTSGVVFALLYGKRFLTADAPELKEAQLLTREIMETLNPIISIVDVFPILDRLPSFLSFLAPWRSVGKRLHVGHVQMYRKSMDKAAESCTPWNWSKFVLTSPPPGMCRQDIEFTLGEMLEAGGHAPAAILEFILLACLDNSDAMRRAQEELDSVVGGDRLPTSDDAKNLPYLHAFIQEVLRWRPAIPFGIPHSPIKDDTYGKYLIPKDAIILPNHWCLDLDGEVFENPDNFIPERWLNQDDLPLASFGFGKRTCPAQCLARHTLFLAMARILWAFNINWKNGEARNVRTLGLVIGGVACKPEPFQVTFNARSPAHERIVRDEWEGRGEGQEFEQIMDSIGLLFN